MCHVKQRKAIEILPLIQFTSDQLQNKLMDEVKLVSQIMDPKQGISGSNINASLFVTSEQEFENFDELPPGDDPSDVFMPFYEQ